MTFLMVMAHPDDELIWGWPLLQNRSVTKKLLMCSSDLYNKDRAWCNGRKFPLMEICRKYDIELKCLDYPSGFYREETREGGLAKICADIGDNIRRLGADYIFTHNPHGEYGHLDHKLVFNLVLDSAPCPIYYTDIVLPSNWPSSLNISERERRVYYGRRTADCVLDTQEYQECEALYRSAGVWTWDRPPVERCGLYKLP